MKTILQTDTHQIQIPNGAMVGYPKDEAEKIWRDSELLRTDSIMLLPDYPHSTRLKAYRKKLRNYPSSSNFPNGERPSE